MHRFLVLWSICWSSLIHFKNGSKYLTKWTAHVFIPFMKFLLYSLVSSRFLILVRYSFLIFSFISTCLLVSASNIAKFLYVSFSSSILIFSWFGSFIPFVICHFPPCTQFIWLQISLSNSNNFKKIYLIHIWDPNRYFHSKSDSWPGSNGNDVVTPLSFYLFLFDVNVMIRSFNFFIQQYKWTTIYCRMLLID